MCKKRIDGVYLIKNIVTGKVRVGSAKNVPKRFSNYKARLRNGNGNKLMQEDYNWYGEQSFDFILLEECKVKDLYLRERYYLELYKDCAMYNKNAIKNCEKKIRRGKEAKKYKEKRSAITAGEKNGHNTKLSKTKVFTILDMYTKGINKKSIADEFDIHPSYISRIGKDRWVKEFNEWKQIEKEAKSIGVDIASQASDTLASVNA